MPAIELSAEVRQDGRARREAQRNQAGFAVTAYRPLPWCSEGVSRPTCQQLHHYLRQRYRRKRGVRTSPPRTTRGVAVTRTSRRQRYNDGYLMNIFNNLLQI